MIVTGTPSKLLIGGLAVVAVLLLGVTASETESLKTVLVVGACIAIIAVVPFTLAWLRPRRGGPETLTTPASIKARLEELRQGATSVSAIWSGKYDADEVASYFEVEKQALHANPQLRISRVINPAVIPAEHFELLQSIREKYAPRFTLLEDSTLRSYELYIADYPLDTRESVAVVVINNTLSKRPQVAVVLDPAKEQQLAGAVEAIRSWWTGISDELPAFDPIAIERWDHIARRYTTLVTENANKIAFLDQYAGREKQMIADYLQSVAEEGREICVMEVGCGDGRALFSVVPTELARSTSYVLGVDYAPAMITAAARELSRLRALRDKMRPDARMLMENTAFFQLNAANMRRFFDDGRLNEFEQLQQAAPDACTAAIDHSIYGASRKVFCCLLNTVGVIEPEGRRGDMLEAMLSCLGVDDSLVLTVFAAERFADEAPTLYRDLQEMIDTEVEDTQFDNANATFSVAGNPGYYSHWFTETELHQLVNGAKDPLEREGRSFDPVHVDRMGAGGYFVLVKRTG